MSIGAGAQLTTCLLSIYLRSNPLMKDGFSREDVPGWPLGNHPAWNFLFGHVTASSDHNQNTIFLMGPGHGGPAGTAFLLDGHVSRDLPIHHRQR